MNAPPRAVRTMGMFPLSTVLFPGAELPLHVFEEQYQALMADCLSGDGRFGVVLIARGSEVGGGDQRVETGTVARVAGHSRLDDGRMVVATLGERRLRVRRWLPDGPYPRAEIEELEDREDGLDGFATVGPASSVAAAESAVRRLRSLLSELGEVPALPHGLDLGGRGEQAGWVLCALAPFTLLDRQKLLASPTLPARMGLLVELCTAMAEDVVAMLAGGMGG